MIESQLPPPAIGRHSGLTWVAALAGATLAAGWATASETLHFSPVTADIQRPVHVTAPPGDVRRLCVVEQYRNGDTGWIWMIKDGVLLPDPFLEIAAVATGWGQSGVSADINRDGVVDVLDLLQVLLDWGPCRGGWRS